MNSSSAPLLVLAMIVKDEAHSIQRTVESVRDHVDRWLLLDTGSTDGTQELARAAFGDVPGEVIEEPFVDFGTTRTRALQLAEPRGRFALMLSGDETLEGGRALRRFCQAHADAEGPGHGAYLMMMRWGRRRTLLLPRVTRSGAGFFYQGVTHEYLTHPTDTAEHHVPKAAISHDVEGRDAERKRRSWERDLELLQAACERSPGDTRAAFYLAQTLEDLGQHPQAAVAYLRRASLGGPFIEETFQAYLRAGRCALAAGAPSPQLQELWLRAHTLLPQRAEPLYELARHWHEDRQSPAVAFLYAQRATQLPYPEDAVLPLDPELYRVDRFDLLAIVAFHVGERELGERALRRALRARPDDARLLENLELYRQKWPR
jgi:glycosyltransferase involved in cell wall biosynthesis